MPLMWHTAGRDDNSLTRRILLLLSVIFQQRTLLFDRHGFHGMLPAQGLPMTADRFDKDQF